MNRNGLLLEDAVVEQDSYIRPEVRIATISLLEEIKREFGGKVSLMLVLGYQPDDSRYISALKHDFIGNAIAAVARGVSPFESQLEDEDVPKDPEEREKYLHAVTQIHYLTEIAGGQLYVNSFEAHPAISILTRYDDDGAYLLDEQGGFLNNAKKLRPDPEDVLDMLGIPNHRELWKRYGFSRKVGTKHTAGIAASVKIPHSEIYVVSEESGAIRGFHRGKIFFSPYEEEVMSTRYLC